MKYSITSHCILWFVSCWLFLSTSSSVTAQWTQSNGPIDARINSIAHRNGVVFAGTSNGGVFRSIDSAVSWTAINNGIPVGVSSLDFVDTVLYAGAATGGLYKSTNGGNSWSQVGTQTFNGISSVVSVGLRLFLGDHSGVYMSFDNGTNWIQANSVPGPRAMKTVGNSIFVASWGAGIYRSTDIGSSWTKLTNGLTATFFYDMTIVGSTIIVGSWPSSATDTGALFRSTDNGASWTNITDNFPSIMNEVYKLASSSSTLYATGLWMRGIYVSKDFGNTWKYGGLHGGQQNIGISSMKISGSRLYVGMEDSNRIAYADTNFILNYKPATLTLPLDNAVNISLTPTFRWSKRTFLNNHYIEISTSSSDWSQSRAFDVTTNTYTPSTPLSYKTKYYWRIAEGNTFFGVSDTFSFTTVDPFTLTYPNGGEILAAGDSVDIMWTGYFPTDTARLYYTTDDTTWNLITNNASSGLYRWKVPKVESNRCKIRYQGSDKDTSDANFTISIPKGIASSIDFGTTNVGNSVQKTSYCISTGIALLKVQEVLFQKGIDFYLKGIARKGDSTFITIVFDPKLVGIFNDNVFIITQAGDTIKTDVKGEALSTEKLTITYPNGNEILTAKDTVTIRWKGVEPADTVRLEYSTDGGTIWHLISDKATGLSISWKAPRIESDKCLIRARYGSRGEAGSVDTTFNSGTGFSLGVFCSAKQTDGKLLFGGDFRSYNGYPCGGIVRLHTDGSYDTTFVVGEGFLGNGYIYSIAIQNDGKIVVAGDFSKYDTTLRNNIIRLLPDGSVDRSFNPGNGFNDQVNSIALQDDGKIVAVGEFTSYYDTMTTNKIVRILSDGTPDASFQTGTGFKGLNEVGDCVLTTGTKIYAIGRLNDYNGNIRGNLFCLNLDGSCDTTFGESEGIYGWSQYMSFQPDKKIIVGGTVTHANLIPRNKIARLNTDGSTDTSFVSYFDNLQTVVYGTSVQTDGKIYASGSFAKYDNVSRTNFVRLYPEGELDTDFEIGTGFNHNTLGSISNSNKIIVYGWFDNFNGIPHGRIVQLFGQSTYITEDSSDALFAISIPKGVSSTLDFGKADTATNTSKSYTLTNTGKVPLALTMLQNSKGDPFSTQDTAKLVIPEGKDYKVNMSFIPTAVASYTDTMKWVTIAGDTIISTMSGEGIASKPGVNATIPSNVISICQFIDTLVTVKVTGGSLPYQYTWSYKDGSTIIPSEIVSGGKSNDTTIRLSPSITNTYRVVVLDNKGQSDTAFVDITVKKRPSPKLLLKGSATICDGDSVIIEVVNLASYSDDDPIWSDGSIGATLWVKSSGVYYCNIDSNGCIGVSDSLKITVNSRPTVSVSQVGDELVSTSGDAYQWLSSDGKNITDATSQRFVPSSDGKYAVRLTLNGCSATSTFVMYKKQDNQSTIIVFDLNFGQQVVSNIIGRNAPLRNSIKILNNGTIDRTIDSIIIANTVFDLKKNSLPRIVPPGVTVSFNTDFTPLAIGLYSDEIVVYAGTEIIRATIQGEGIALPSDGVITEIELVPNKLEVSPGDTLFVYLRIKDEQPQASKATKFIANMQYDSRVLQWLPRSRQYNDEDSKRTNYWSLNVQEKRRFQGNPRLDTLMFLVKLADVDSTSLVFSDSTAFIWTDANGKVFPACRDSIVYIKVCKDGGISQLIRFAKPDMVKQVAPNPSIGNSTITLSMGITGPCSVSLNDIFGRVIQEVNYPILTEGDHTLQFDNASLETGTYYVVMKTGFAISTQKISIVK